MQYVCRIMLQYRNTKTAVSILEYNLETNYTNFNAELLYRILKLSCDGKKMECDKITAERSIHPHRNLAGLLQWHYGRCQEDTVWLGHYNICPYS